MSSRAYRKSNVHGFAPALRAARLELGLSQEALAKLARMKPCAVSFFETGARQPSLKNLARLADALDVGIDRLLGR